MRLGAYEWPYPIRYSEENEVIADVLVLGGGVAGCWASIAAAKKGAQVTLVEKGATIASGAGAAGCDHWQFVCDSPCAKVTAEELAQALVNNCGGYASGISRYIQCREGYETLLELEKMGAKVRDTEDEFKGADFRDEETKLLFAYDYENKYTIRVWGTTFKRALYNECKRLGVKIYDRVMATSLLTEGGKQGSRVVGATGLNVRTGEFYVFKGKAIILCLSRPQRNWIFSSELRGISSFRPANCVGNGHAMAWRVGAEFTMMEKSIVTGIGSPYLLPPYGTGNPRNTWYPCTMVDANGKEIPWVDRDGNVLATVSQRTRPVPGQKFFLAGGGISSAPHPGLYEYRGPKIAPDLEARVRKGEFVLPLYADLPSMPEHERRAIFGLMVGEEGKSKIPVYQLYTQAGFDPDKDLLQSYRILRGDFDTAMLPQDRTFGESGVAGGMLVDWDLKSNLEGLYGAGDMLFGTEGYSHAATTGRYAGRKAADYALGAGEPVVVRKQVEDEKARVYAPIGRKDGIEWKELNAGICRNMQNYCGELKNEELLDIGLKWLEEISEGEASTLCAENPHQLMRTLDVLDILTCSQMIVHACLARKASSEFLHLIRTDYPEMDPPERHKWLVIKLENGKVEVRELPVDFWGDLKESYEAHRGS